MNRKHRRTLIALFKEPTDGNIEWRQIEELFGSLGCETIEGRGSGVTFVKGCIKASFHRPHPHKEALKYPVEAARDFLKLLGVKP